MDWCYDHLLLIFLKFFEETLFFLLYKKLSFICFSNYVLITKLMLANFFDFEFFLLNI